MPKNPLILGLDPGLEKTGFGLIKIEEKMPRYASSGIVSCQKGAAMANRLAEYWRSFDQLIGKHQPTCCAIEDVFVGPHPQAALRLGMAYGVLLTKLGTLGLEVFSYAPTRIKQDIAGEGHASKEALAQMTYRHLGISGNLSHHATDALAVALCHFYASQQNKRLSS